MGCVLDQESSLNSAITLTPIEACKQSVNSASDTQGRAPLKV